MNRDHASETPPRHVGKPELFLGFAKIGLLGFGGIAPWARHVIVEERAWVDDREFAALLGIGQILPGPNTMNAAVMLGDRFQGAWGAVLCLLGQMLFPLFIVTSLGMLYARCATVPEVGAALTSAAAGAAGLVMGSALKMAYKVRLKPAASMVGVAAFAATALLRWPLAIVVAALVPLSVCAAAWEAAREARR